MLHITKQPDLNLNYWLFHGEICGYPTLSLSVPKSQYSPGRQYHMLCTLHPYRNNLDTDCNNGDKRILPLSGHFIRKISKTEDGDDDESHANCNSNIFEAMELQTTANNKNVLYRYEMENCRIVLVDWKIDGSVDDNNWWRSLNERKAQIIQMNMEFVDEGAGHKYDETEFCLGFTAFEKLPNCEHFTPITPTTYSKRISLRSSPYLRDVIPQMAHISGGEEVALLYHSLKKYKAATVKVYTSEFNFGRKINIANIEIVEKNAERKKNIIWNKNTILFQAPPLPLYLQNSDCYIELFIPSTKETSNAIMFLYRKYEADEFVVEIIKENMAFSNKLNNKTNNVIEISDPTDPSYNARFRSSDLKWILVHNNCSEDFHQRFDNQFGNNVYKPTKLGSCGLRVEVDNGFTTVLPLNVILLSEAIEEDFNKVNRSLTSPMTTLTARQRKNLNPKFKIISPYDALEYAMDFIHAYREQMISEESTEMLFPAPPRKTDYMGFFCMSKDRSFRPMICTKLSLVEKDLQDNTPLHTAIALRHRKSIDQFVDIFSNYAKYPKDVQEDLKSIFSVNNGEGHNVLQAAICNEMDDLVKAMLVYCKENSINVDDYKIADGTKVSLPQLAVANELPNIVGSDVFMLLMLIYYFYNLIENVGVYIGQRLS